MFRNYLKTALRSLLKHRFFSAINIFGLAVSMAICMAIMMLVADQMTYDRHNSKRDRTYRINSVPVSPEGHNFNETATTPLPLRQELLENYTAVSQCVRLVRGFANNWIELDQNINVPVSGYFADPEVFDFFEYELEYGDAKTALAEPNTVVLTKRAARKLFRQENPVGELLQVKENEVYKVTGVLKETSKKSHIVFDALASISTLANQKGSKDLTNWFQYTSGWVYIQLGEGKTSDDLKRSLTEIEKKRFAVIPNPDTQQRVEFKLQPLMGIAPGPLINNPIGPFLPWIIVYFFAGIGGVVMLTSCFNFTNLSIARSLTRAREIGIRKVTGALRWQVFCQFISESVLIAMFSLALAFGILAILKPMILELSFAQIMHWGLEENYVVYGVFVVFALLVGILAGLFPAIVLSGFQPIKVLKSLNNVKLFSKMGLRKALLVSQFTFSLIFILTVIVVFNQLNLFMRSDHGFTMEKKIVVHLNHTSSTVLKNELLKYPHIESVAASSHVPASGESRGMSFKRTMQDKDWLMTYYYAVDESYLTNMNLGLVAGKFYDPEQGASNKNFIVLSELAVKQLHFESAMDAIGQDIIIQNDSSARKIIGVVKNYNHQLLMEEMKPLALAYVPEDYSMVQVSYTGTYDEAGKTIEAAWAKLNPAMKVDYKDFSTEIHKIYNVFFGDLADILTVISFLAIVISSLGLLGMATYSTETRRKEISIRKILGSEKGALVYLLSKGFLVILGIAIVIAVPIAYLLNNLWLEHMARRVTMGPGVIFTGIGILIVFGVFTIGSQTWKAAFINPVDNLKE